jgi:hypothetical protein
MGNVILGSDGIAIRQGVYEEKVTQETDLGRFIDFQDGRRFRYCQADAAITRGHMAAAGAVVANDNTVTQTAMTVALSNGYIGEKEVSVLLAAATTAHLYADGFLSIEGGLGLGYLYRIKDNKAGGALYTTPCILTLYDPIVIALDATSIISLTKLKYKDVVVAPTTVVREPIGVPLIDITDNYYFWAQTRGPALIVVDDSDTVVTGQFVMGGDTDAGACEPVTATSSVIVPYGKVVQVAAADTYALIDLQLE